MYTDYYSVDCLININIHTYETSSVTKWPKNINIGS